MKAFSSLLGSLNSEKKERIILEGLKLVVRLQLGGGFLLLLLGIFSIPLMACFSYFAMPIWSSLLIFVPNSILGIMAVERRKRSTTIAVILLSILGCLMSCVLIVVYIIAARRESALWCQPDSILPHRTAKNCSPVSQRRTTDILVVVDSIYLLTLTLISLACALRFIGMTTYTDDACARCVTDTCYSSSPPGYSALLSQESQRQNPQKIEMLQTYYGSGNWQNETAKEASDRVFEAMPEQLTSKIPPLPQACSDP
ncbi:uncharacterized protein [Diadema antillarum]|uniref:uncharacterized protein n=1 Tax=Diadema antillarum TaxID=105358 RepID=UPI003A83EFBB